MLQRHGTGTVKSLTLIKLKEPKWLSGGIHTSVFNGGPLGSHFGSPNLRRAKMALRINNGEPILHILNTIIHLGPTWIYFSSRLEPKWIPHSALMDLSHNKGGHLPKWLPWLPKKFL